MSSSTPRRRPRRKRASTPACAAARKPRPPPVAPAICPTASRALGLIELGALDEAGVDALAARLGVGERQLRRQFRQHLGASPVAVAQTRRVLLAKQLIHETRLPMAEIAFAAGFGSIRRFNEIFLALFGRAPGELRRSGKPDVSAGPQGEIKLLLRYRPPYDWSAMLDFLRVRAIPGIERVTANSYTRTIGLDGAQGTVRVEPGAGNALQATVRFPQLHALPTIIARLRRVFDLASDPAALAAQLAHDPVMAALTAARPGLRVPGAWDGFELALRAVLGQQITVGAAIKLAGKLVAAHGQPLEQPDGDLTHLFPTPAAVAAAALAGPHLFDTTDSLDTAVARLREIRGVGEWTAQYIALRQLREPDAFPASDIGLIRALEKLESREYTPAQLLARAEAWRPWRAYAAQHLWAEY